MTDRDFHSALLEVSNEFHRKIDDGFQTLREHIDQGNDRLHTRMDAHDVRLGTLEHNSAHLGGAWKAMTVLGSALGLVAGSLFSWLLGLFGRN